MSYLDPPPPPAPVVVMKDVGGYVDQYQAQTEIYRASGREVRLHECRSACTLALSLPNVCVYADSTLKFHLAYDPRNHESNYDVSRQLFEAYPPAVRGRLGVLTRQYKALRGSELIALGVRDCNAPKPAPEIMVASTEPAGKRGSGAAPAAPAGALFSGWMRNVAALFSPAGEGAAERAAAPAPAKAVAEAPSGAAAPLPPPRPAEIGAESAQAGEAPEAAPLTEETEEAGQEPLPPQRPSVAYAYGVGRMSLPRGVSGSVSSVIGGAQPILPARFIAYEGSAL